jgi:fluoride exporter
MVGHGDHIITLLIVAQAMRFRAQIRTAQSAAWGAWPLPFTPRSLQHPGGLGSPGWAGAVGVTMTDYLWVAIGGALGSMARFWLATAVAKLTGPRFPWGTLLINVSGSFVIGLFAAFAGSHGAFSLPADIEIFAMVGICGGFTTFSSFSLQTLELLEGGAAVQAGLYVLSSVTLGLLAVWAGVATGSL